MTFIVLQILLPSLKTTVVKYGQAFPPKSLMDTPTGSSKRSAESTISNLQIFFKFLLNYLNFKI